MGRLLLVDLGEDEDRFEQFMMPLASTSFVLTVVPLYATSSPRRTTALPLCNSETALGFALDLSAVLPYLHTKDKTH